MSFLNINIKKIFKKLHIYIPYMERERERERKIIHFFVGLDSWVNLTRVDPDEEVQGEIHLRLELLKGVEKTSVRCKVIEAR